MLSSMLGMRSMLCANNTSTIKSLSRIKKFWYEKIRLYLLPIVWDHDTDV